MGYSHHLIAFAYKERQGKTISKNLQNRCFWQGIVYTVSEKFHRLTNI